MGASSPNPILNDLKVILKPVHFSALAGWDTRLRWPLWPWIAALTKFLCPRCPAGAFSCLLRGGSEFYFPSSSASLEQRAVASPFRGLPPSQTKRWRKEERFCRGTSQLDVVHRADSLKGRKIGQEEADYFCDESSKIRPYRARAVFPQNINMLLLEYIPEIPLDS